MQIAEPEDENYEVVDGMRVPIPSSTPRHAFVRDFLTTTMRVYFQQRSEGTAVVAIDCQLRTGLIRRPDISVFLADRMARMDLNEIPVPFAPDVAVEVLSASDNAIAFNRKVRDYLSEGSSEVWVADYANEELFIHSPGGIRLLVSGDTFESPLLPGFSVAVNAVFAAL